MMAERDVRLDFKQHFPGKKILEVSIMELNLVPILSKLKLAYIPLLNLPVPARTGICDACGERRLWDDLAEINVAPVAGASICAHCRFRGLSKEAA